MPESPLSSSSSRSARFDPASITRPDPALLKYYLIVSALTVAGFPFVIWPLLFKFNTLRYTFDDKGVSMAYGLLFRKEIYLTYRRIQDIHVTRNLIHRWLGLSAVAIQTASGSGGAEMTIEGITNPEALRDFLYTKMRGARDGEDDGHEEAHRGAEGPEKAEPNGMDQEQAGGDEALALLHEIRDELRALRTRSH